MGSIRIDVTWCPSHANRFFTVGTDLRLYETQSSNGRTEDASRDVLPGADLLSINADFQYLRCLSCCQSPDLDVLLAVGQDSGKVVLASFGRTYNGAGLVGREFLPKQMRRCNTVAWNPVEFNILGAGLDKHKGDNSILIWDVQQTSSSSVTKPKEEYGYSESAQSFSWFFHQPRSFVCGMNNKHIKIFDLREGARRNSTTTKACYGVCVDPFVEHRIASYQGNQIVLWDIRNFDKPVTTQTESGQVVKIAWCPTRSNLIGLFTKDSNVVKLYNIQQSPALADDVEPTMVERFIQPFNNVMLSSFCWHPTNENRMLVITPDNQAKDYMVFDRIALNWSPANIVWTHAKKLIHYWDCTDDGYSLLDDYAVKMRQRALLGYGLKEEELWKNAETLPDNKHLKVLWSWLDVLKLLDDSSKLRLVNKNDYAVGVRAILQDLTHPRQPDSGLRQAPNSYSFMTYSSKERDKALWLCGWKTRHENLPANIFSERLARHSSYSRKAAVHLFNMRIKEAIVVLKEAANANPDSNVSMVAMALSGYTAETRDAWRSMSRALQLSLGDPYLEALFTFLTSEDDGYWELLNDRNLAVEDRIAFACVHLPDAKLVQYIERLTTSTLEEGNLDGILLTGMTEEGGELLQKYVDLTGDIQTASLALLHAHSSPLSGNSQAQLWVDRYRNLLDRWRLWHERAQFDCAWARHHSGSSSVPGQQVVVSCNFCGLAASPYLHMQGALQGRGPRSTGASGQAGSHLNVSTPSVQKSKVTCCPSCRKPLPRCALCLTNLGTPAGSYWRKYEHMDQVNDEKLSDSSTWFTWCQTCRHGGHASHISGWFKEHTECPVTGCSCKCWFLGSPPGDL
ncbi:GATOR2 complex protein MIOS-like [Ornithodoros turicata]|uniref:GATOR2 complex protein MIOS-like n=1 Tax=Ornithodoros turicata TaxID=34597 RepID=UPI0031399B91